MVNDSFGSREIQKQPKLEVAHLSSLTPDMINEIGVLQNALVRKTLSDRVLTQEEAEELKRVRETYDHEHGALFSVMSGQKLAGFLALKKEKGRASVEVMRVEEENVQVIEQLLFKLEEYQRKENVEVTIALAHDHDFLKDILNRRHYKAREEEDKLVFRIA